MHIKPLFRQHLAKNQRENNIKISRNGIVWLKPQSLFMFKSKYFNYFSNNYVDILYSGL